MLDTKQQHFRGALQIELQKYETVKVIHNEKEKKIKMKQTPKTTGINLDQMFLKTNLRK